MESDAFFLQFRCFDRFLAHTAGQCFAAITEYSPIQATLTTRLLTVKTHLATVLVCTNYNTFDLCFVCFSNILCAGGCLLPAVPIFRLVLWPQLGEGSALFLRWKGPGRYPTLYRNILEVVVPLRIELPKARMIGREKEGVASKRHDLRSNAGVTCSRRGWKFGGHLCLGRVGRQSVSQPVSVSIISQSKVSQLVTLLWRCI